MNAFFSEILNEIRELKRRISKFETWEPATSTDVSAHAYLSSNQAIPLGAYAQVTFNAEAWDTDSIHSGGTFTIPYDGKYLFNLEIYTAGLTGNMTFQLYKSATEYSLAYFTGTSIKDGQMSCIMNCTAGDTVILQINPSVNITILGLANTPYLSYMQVQKLA